MAEAARWLLVDQACYETPSHRIRHECDDNDPPTLAWVAYRKVPGNRSGLWLGESASLAGAKARCAFDLAAQREAEKGRVQRHG